jgi:hypothetical protein
VRVVIADGNSQGESWRQLLDNTKFTVISVFKRIEHGVLRSRTVSPYRHHRLAFWPVRVLEAAKSNRAAVAPKALTRKRPRLRAALINNQFSKRCRYCFGGVLVGALVAGVVDFVLVLDAGLTGLAALLPAAGAGTPD